MKFSILLKIVSFLTGLLFVAGGASALLVLSLGSVSVGLAGLVVMCVLQLLAAATFLVLPFLPRVGKAFGAFTLLCFAGVMLVVVFNPALAAAGNDKYQVGAIALAVLLVARLVLPSRRARGRGRIEAVGQAAA